MHLKQKINVSQLSLSTLKHSRLGNVRKQEVV